MAKKCYQCGTIYDGWSCPICSVKEKLEEQKRDMERLVEKSTKDQQRKIEESLKEQEKIVKQAQQETRDALEDAIEKQIEIAEETFARQKKLTSEGWKLQAAAKIKQSMALLKAGLYDESLKLSLSAISQDPSNLFGYLLASTSFQKTGKIQEAKGCLSKAILLLKTEEYKRGPSEHLSIFERLLSLNMPEELAQKFLFILYTNIECWFLDVDVVMWPGYSKEERRGISEGDFHSAAIICTILTALNFLEQAHKLSNHLLNQVLNYRFIERGSFETRDGMEHWQRDRSIEFKCGLLSQLIDLEQDVLSMIPCSEDEINLLIKKSGLLTTAKSLAINIIELIEKTREKEKNLFNLIDTLMSLIEIENRLDTKVSEDVVLKSLRNVPHNERQNVFKIFDKVREKFLEKTINLMREKILQRYKEWKPEIENEIRENAKKWAIEEADNRKKPRIIGWSSGIGSFIILSGFTGEYVISLILSVIIGFSLWLCIWENIRRKLKKERISFLKNNEKNLLSNLESI